MMAQSRNDGRAETFSPGFSRYVVVGGGGIIRPDSATHRNKELRHDLKTAVVQELGPDTAVSHLVLNMMRAKVRDYGF